MKKFLLPILKYILGFGILAVVIWLNWKPANGSKGLADALQQPIHPIPLVLASFICLVSLLITFVRWFLLVRAQNLPFTLTNALRLGMVGNYFNTLLPGSVGGDVVKAAFLAREQSRRAVAIATIILDRIIGLVGLIWVVAVLGSLFWITGTLDALTERAHVVGDQSRTDAMIFRLKGTAATALGIACCSFLFWMWLQWLPDTWGERYATVLGRLRWGGSTLAEFWRALWMYRSRGGVVGLALLMAMVGHLGFILVFYFAALTVLTPAEIPPWEAHFLLVPIGVAIQAGVPSPGGVGGGELIFGELYQLFGSASFSDGVLASLMFRVVSWALGLLGYLVYLRMRPALRLPVNNRAAATPVQDATGSMEGAAV